MKLHRIPARLWPGSPSLPIALFVVVAAFLAPRASAQTTAFTYQGRLTDNTIAANGNYDLRFSLYAAAAGGGFIGSQVVVNPTVVTNGLFTASLDFGTNFPGADRWLQIEVRPSGSAVAYTILTPRQKMTSAPYATRAATAGTSAALSGNISASQIAGGTLDVAVIGNGTLPAAKLGADSIAAGQLANNAVGNGEIAASAVTADKLAANIGVWNKSGNTINYTAGSVGIGTTNPNLAPFVVNAQTNLNTAVFGDSQPICFSRSWPVLHFNSYYSGGGGINNIFTGGNTVLNYAGQISLEPSTGHMRFATTSGSMTSHTNVTSTTRMILTNTGEVRIGTNPSPQGALLDVEGDVRINDRDLFLRANTDDSHGLGWYGTGKLFGTAAPDGPVLYGWAGGGLGVANPDIMILSWDWQGNVGVGNADQPGSLNVNTGVGNVTIRNEGGLVPGINVSGGGIPGVLRLRNSLEVWPNDAGTSPGRIDVRAMNGGSTIILDGESGQATVKTLNITGGSDLAEPFHMSEADIGPGSVVIIDEENPGQLKRSHGGYDTRVAGIVSGGNGIEAGISLQQHGAMEGGQKVALTGRAYALADAATTPIKAGDLLTTSDVPGHVMKVTDHSRAQGAIIGKAMSPLLSGRGMVLVLVNLQ